MRYACRYAADTYRYVSRLHGSGVFMADFCLENNSGPIAQIEFTAICFIPREGGNSFGRRVRSFSHRKPDERVPRWYEGVFGAEERNRIGA